MTHLYRAAVSTLDRRGADTARLQKKKDGRNWLHVDPNNNSSLPQRVMRLLLL